MSEITACFCFIFCTPVFFCGSSKQFFILNYIYVKLSDITRPTFTSTHEWMWYSAWLKHLNHRYNFVFVKLKKAILNALATSLIFVLQEWAIVLLFISSRIFRQGRPGHFRQFLVLFGEKHARSSSSRKKERCFRRICVFLRDHQTLKYH
jgi:hypothetical protein